MKNNQSPKFVRWAIVASIAILLSIFTVVTVEYLFVSPTYNDFYPRDKTELQDKLLTRESCVNEGGVWKENPKQVNENIDIPDGFCDLFSNANSEYKSAKEDYAQTAFIIFLISGIGALLVGVFLKGSSIVSAGLSYGGVLILVIGGVRFLGDLDRIFQVFSIGIALVILLIIAYWKFRDEKL